MEQIKVGGWDLVSVMSVERINQMLHVNKKQLISSFSFSESILGSNFEANGEVGSWTIIQGGSGSLLRIQLNISSGTMIASNMTIDLTELKPIFEVSLQLASKNSTMNDLVFSMEHVGKYGDSAKPTFITPVGLEGPEDTLNKLGESGKIIFLDNLAQYINRHRDNIVYVFANFNTQEVSQEIWLKPVDIEYLYVETLTGMPYLAVLSNISIKDRSHCSNTVDPQLLKEEIDVVVAISRKVVLENIIKSAFETTIGIAPERICFDNEHERLVNVDSFYLKSIKVGAINYKPKINRIEVSIEGDHVRINVSGSCNLKAGISMDFTVDSSSKMVYNNQTGECSFIKYSQPKIIYHTSIPWYMHLIDIVAGAVSELVLNIVVNEISESIVSHLKVNLGANNIKAQVIKWNGIENLTINNVRLDESLIFEGNFKEME